MVLSRARNLASRSVQQAVGQRTLSNQDPTRIVFNSQSEPGTSLEISRADHAHGAPEVLPSLSTDAWFLYEDFSNRSTTIDMCSIRSPGAVQAYVDDDERNRTTGGYGIIRVQTGAVVNAESHVAFPNGASDDTNTGRTIFTRPTAFECRWRKASGNATEDKYFVCGLYSTQTNLRIDNIARGIYFAVRFTGSLSGGDSRRGALSINVAEDNNISSKNIGEVAKLSDGTYSYHTFRIELSHNTPSRDGVEQLPLTRIDRATFFFDGEEVGNFKGNNANMPVYNRKFAQAGVASMTVNASNHNLDVDYLYMTGPRV